ncbi:hypothetical protein FZEAL_7522 [Fusarium zealandicum]|uniref:DUF4246 domain-containing protein n=1 Tax=Fusarium zealandicum TaxID=1053134 RepID=A0A8H4UGM0_9HYPO|nr:hypothetical protein FZEAL_7522 [Fusarium zealandicum]
MASIELTPKKPSFPLGVWHVEGQMNEHIFRMQITNIPDGWDVSRGSFNWMERVYGTVLGLGAGSPCIQSYGNIETKEGRLLAFPDVFDHWVSSELQDKTNPGHCRFIALRLVDHSTRIINTANVLQQQQQLVDRERI